MPVSLAQQQDPTRPAAFVKNTGVIVKQTEPKLKLQSIIKSRRAFKAIISGRLYQVGDVVDDFRVLRINSKQVVLANDDKQIKLELYDNKIKR